MILEDIVENREKSDKLIEEINNAKNVKTNLKSLILKLYRLAYKYSGIKHRDFPYTSYYNFLLSLNLEELDRLKEEFNDLVANKEIELYEIYGKVILEKLKEQKKENKKRADTKIKKPNLIQDLINKIEGNSKVNNDKIKSNEYNYLISYVINNTIEFDCKDKKFGWQVIILLANEINLLLTKIKVSPKNNTQNLLDEAHHHLMENKNIFDLVGQLKFIDPGKIKLFKERMCFWLNCFNYLLLFTFFYKKWNISTEIEWKNFFKNVKYSIGLNLYSFHDILYILYKRILFFPSTYKIKENLKKMRVNKTEDAKAIEKNNPLLYNPFMLYVPIKDFVRPIIYEQLKLDNQSNQRIKEYFNSFIKIDDKNNIIIPELLSNYVPNFLDKEYKKFQSFLEISVFEIIKNKKFKAYIQKDFEWKLDFERLLNY